MDKVMNHIFLRMKKGEGPSPAYSWLALWGDPKYEDPGMMHRWGYFKNDLVKMLSEAGFEDLKDEQPNYHFPDRDMRFTAVKPQPLENKE